MLEDAKSNCFLMHPIKAHKINKDCLTKEVQRKENESVDTIKHLSQKDSTREEVPSIKDILADNSCSTIEKVIP